MKEELLHQIRMQVSLMRYSICKVPSWGEFGADMEEIASGITITRDSVTSETLALKNLKF